MADWEYKMYSVICEEAVRAAGGNIGKMMAQAQHATEGAFWDAEVRFPVDAKAYKKMPGHAKAVLLGKEAELVKLHKIYKKICGVDLITDAAHTVFKKPTITFLGIGPLKSTLKEAMLDGLSAYSGKLPKEPT